jgi:hypothetical protein
VRSPKYSGRLRPPAAIEGHGEDEIAALTDLANQLRDLRDVERRMVLEETGRAAYVQGAEEHSRATLGRQRASYMRSGSARRAPWRC